jgi:alkylhydroperoxidase family enzyme
MSPRISPATPPFDEQVAASLERLTRPPQPPLRLFTTLARDPRLLQKFLAGSLLDKGHLSLRQREIAILRTTALCRSEYEWGVHVAVFSGKAGLTSEEVRATAEGRADAACWTSPEARALMRLCDALHARCDIDDELWGELAAHYSDGAILELLMVAGFYRTVSYLTNGLRLPL